MASAPVPARNRLEPSAATAVPASAPVAAATGSLLDTAAVPADDDAQVSLRGYQTAMIDEADAVFAAGARSVILQLGTGGGKTMAAVGWLRRLLDADPGLVIGWLVHTRGLRRQAVAAAELWDVETVDWTQVDARRRRWRPGRIHAFGAGMKIPPMLPKARTVLVADECHRSAAATVAAHVGHPRWKKVLGLSATPARRGWPDTVSESQARFAQQWDRVVRGPTLSELVDAGMLAEVVLRDPRVAGGDRRVLRDDKMRESGYTADSEAAFERTLSLDAAVRWSAAQPPRPTIWFCASQRAARRAGRLLPASAVILADTAESHRDRCYQQFNDGRLRHLISVGVLTEGVDLPKASRVMLLRPTSSRILLSQACGRGMRPPGDVEIVDFVANFASLGCHPLDDLPWELTLTGRVPTRRAIRPPQPLRTCPTPQCDTVIDAKQVRLCPTCFAETGRWCVACGRPLRGIEDGAHRRCVECADSERALHRQWCLRHSATPTLDADQLHDLAAAGGAEPADRPTATAQDPETGRLLIGTLNDAETALERIEQAAADARSAADTVRALRGSLSSAVAAATGPDSSDSQLPARESPVEPVPFTGSDPDSAPSDGSPDDGA